MVQVLLLQRSPERLHRLKSAFLRLLNILIPEKRENQRDVTKELLREYNEEIKVVEGKLNHNKIEFEKFKVEQKIDFNSLIGKEVIKIFQKTQSKLEKDLEVLYEKVNNLESPNINRLS